MKASARLLSTAALAALCHPLYPELLKAGNPSDAGGHSFQGENQVAVLTTARCRNREEISRPDPGL